MPVCDGAVICYATCSFETAICERNLVPRPDSRAVVVVGALTALSSLSAAGVHTWLSDALVRLDRYSRMR